MNDDKSKFLRKQLTYIASMKKEVNKGNYFDLFPMDWHSNENYKLKEEILDEAIEKHCLIIDTSLYGYCMQEGIVDINAIIKAKIK